jgi:hypothetical protein
MANPWPGGIGDGLVVETYIKIFAILLVLGIVATIYDCDGPTDSQEQQSATATPAKSAPVVGLSSVTPTEQSAAVAGLASVTPDDESSIEVQTDVPSTVVATEPSSTTTSNDTIPATESPPTDAPKETVDADQTVVPTGTGTPAPLALAEKRVRLPIGGNYPGAAATGGTQSELAIISKNNGPLVIETRDEHGDLLNTMELPFVQYNSHAVVEGAVIYTDAGLYDFDGELLSNLDFLDLWEGSKVNGIIASRFGDVFYIIEQTQNAEITPKFQKHFSTLPVYSIRDGIGVNLVSSIRENSDRKYSFSWFSGEISNTDYFSRPGNGYGPKQLHTIELTLHPDNSIADSSPSFTTSTLSGTVPVVFAGSTLTVHDWSLTEDGVWIMSGGGREEGSPCLWYASYERSSFSEPSDLVFKNVEDHGVCANQVQFISTGSNLYADGHRLIRLLPGGESTPPPTAGYGCHSLYAVWDLEKVTCTTQTGSTMYVFDIDGSLVSEENLEAGLIIAVSPNGYFLGYDSISNEIFLKHIDRDDREWSTKYDDISAFDLGNNRPSHHRVLDVSDDSSMQFDSGWNRWTYSPVIGEIFHTELETRSDPWGNCTVENFGLLASEYVERKCASDNVILVQRKADNSYLLIERRSDGNLSLVADVTGSAAFIGQPTNGDTGAFLMYTLSESVPRGWEIWNLER